jgi:hypothetical protein
LLSSIFNNPSPITRYSVAFNLRIKLISLIEVLAKSDNVDSCPPPFVVIVVRKSTRLTRHRLYKIMKTSSRARLLERVQQVARHVSNLDDELFPYEDANPCEVCQRITLEELSSGYTHHNFAGLVKSSSKGCKICILLKLACLRTQYIYLDIGDQTQIRLAEEQLLQALGRRDM